MENDCSKAFLDQFISQPDQLHEFIMHCQEDYQEIPFLSIYYEHIDRNFFLAAILPILALLISFLFLQKAADQYLATVISSISRRLNFPPSIAALTLIAFANGAPDIFNAILLHDDEQGPAMTLGSLLGAFIFTSTLVVCNVLRHAPFGI